jgi:hypothetical protein
VEKYGTARQAKDESVIRRIRFECWVPNDTHSKYVILTAFPLQQRLQERASMLRYACIACLVLYYKEKIKCFSVAQSPFPTVCSASLLTVRHLVLQMLCQPQLPPSLNPTTFFPSSRMNYS